MQFLEPLGYSQTAVKGIYAKEGNLNGGDYTYIKITDKFVEKYGYGKRGGKHSYTLTADECTACADIMRED